MSKGDSFIADDKYYFVSFDVSPEFGTNFSRVLWKADDINKIMIRREIELQEQRDGEIFILKLLCNNDLVGQIMDFLPPPQVSKTNITNFEYTKNIYATCVYHARTFKTIYEEVYNQARVDRPVFPNLPVPIIDLVDNYYAITNFGDDSPQYNMREPIKCRFRLLIGQ